MAREPLDVLLRLRRLAVQDQMRALAAAIRAEEAALQEQAARTETITRETATIRSIAERDATLAGFVAWRTRAVQALRAAEAQAAQASEETRMAYAALGDARGAVRAVELGLDQRKAATELAAQQSEQHSLDDATRRPGAAG